MERYQNIAKKKKSLEHAWRDDYDIDMSQQVIDSRRPHIRRLEKVNLSNVKTTNFIDKKLQFVQ